MSSSPSAPFASITADDKGAIVTIVNVFLIILTGLVVVARAIIRFNITRLTAIDDIFLNASLVFAIGQTIAAQLAVTHGLGKHRDDVTSSEFVSYSKAIYASEILTIVTMTLTKLAVCYLVQTIRPKGQFRMFCLALDGFIGLWAFSSIFAVSFQCDLPNPWLLSTERCINLDALYNYIGVVNILTDIALSILPIVMVWDLQLRRDKKIWVLGLFTTRLAVPAVIIPQLVYIAKWLDVLGGDQTFENTWPMIINAVAVNLSVVTACIPSLRRVVTELTSHQTGLKVSENLEMTIGGTNGYTREGTNKSGYSRSNNHSSNNNTGIGHANGTVNSKNKIPYGHNVDSRVGTTATVYTSPDRDEEKIMGSHSSEEHLRDDNIHYTMEVSIQEEDDRISTGEQRQVQRWT